MRASCVISPRSVVTVLFVSAFVLGPGPEALAQPPYVGAGVLADVVRTSGPDEGNVGNGEALGWHLRVGAALGSRWGVELELARSGEIEWRPDVTILAGAAGGIPVLGTVVDLIGARPDIAIFPTPEINIESQLSTLTTSLWWRQRVNRRFDLVYLGGVAFARSNVETEVNYAVPAVTRAGQLLPTRLYAQELTQYDTGVSVGLEAAVAMTEQLRLTPGVRMLAIGSRWIIRPGVGLQWRF